MAEEERYDVAYIEWYCVYCEDKTYESLPEAQKALKLRSKRCIHCGGQLTLNAVVSRQKAHMRDDIEQD